MSDAKTVPTVAVGTPFESPVEPYLTDKEVARRLSLSTKTLEKKVRAGDFLESVHYFRRAGMRRRWKWRAVVEWLEGGDGRIQDDRTVPLASGVRRTVG